MRASDDGHLEAAVTTNGMMVMIMSGLLSLQVLVDSSACLSESTRSDQVIAADELVAIGGTESGERILAASSA